MKTDVFPSLSSKIFLIVFANFQQIIWVIKKIKLIKLLYYFSFICKTPIKVKRLKAITGAQIDNTKGILSVFPRAKEKSFK